MSAITPPNEGKLENAFVAFFFFFLTLHKDLSC